MTISTLERLTEVFRDCFNDDGLTLSAETVAADVDGWDSIAHISLMYAIEDEFGIQFAANELGEFRNVGELVGYLERHATI